jgi:hypothetical protein
LSQLDAGGLEAGRKAVAEIVGYASPARGSHAISAWKVLLQPGAASPTHRLTEGEAFKPLGNYGWLYHWQTPTRGVFYIVLLPTTSPTTSVPAGWAIAGTAAMTSASDSSMMADQRRPRVIVCPPCAVSQP